MFENIIVPNFRDSLIRRSTALKNKVISSLKKLGVDPDYIEFNQTNPLKQGTAFISWYFEDHFCFLSCAKYPRIMENLYAVTTVVTNKVEELLNEQLTIDEFINLFAEDDNILEERDYARKYFNVQDPINLKDLTRQYKNLAKTMHPDTDEGDHDKFQELNKLHKVLKKELE